MNTRIYAISLEISDLNL